VLCVLSCRLIRSQHLAVRTLREGRSRPHESRFTVERETVLLTDDVAVRARSCPAEDGRYMPAPSHIGMEATRVRQLSCCPANWELANRRNRARMRPALLPAARWPDRQTARNYQ
jgi:hypothetical protein